MKRKKRSPWATVKQHYVLLECVVRPERFELPAFWFPPPADSIQLAAQPTTGA